MADIVRAMAFDFGLRQIGVAVGSYPIGTSKPLSILRAREGIPDWREVEQLVARWQPDLLLVGDPLNMDGTPSEIGRRAAKFARRLEGRLGLQVSLVDERLSSFAVKSALAEQGHRGDYHSRPADSLAAELILHTWMESRTR